MRGTSFSATAAARAALGVIAGAVAYTSNFENYPDAVSLLAKGRRLLGNTPLVLEQIRNPLILMRALRRRGFVVPVTRASAPASAPAGRWLRKPRRSGGGHGTSVWKSGSVPRSAYLQSRIAGVPGSIVFAADGRHAVPLGITRQLVGDPAFGAHGFRYCGSLLGGHALFERHAEVAAAARALAHAVTEEFGLVGLNGLDFIAHDGIPYPIEVNPRYSASMELVERAARSRYSIRTRAPATVRCPPSRRRTGRYLERPWYSPGVRSHSATRVTGRRVESPTSRTPGRKSVAAIPSAPYSPRGATPMSATSVS